MTIALDTRNGFVFAISSIARAAIKAFSKRSVPLLDAVAQWVCFCDFGLVDAPLILIFFRTSSSEAAWRMTRWRRPS